jgi:hypothetical protein
VAQETAGAGLLTVQNITITGGDSSSSGGGIFAQGGLTLINSHLHNNHADAFGGGLAVVGELNVSSSLINANNASLGSGGIAGDVVLVITDSTVSNNLGGGIATATDEASSITLINSTVTGNSAAALGAGITSAGSTTLVYSTITNNTATTAFGNIFSQQLFSFGSVVTNGQTVTAGLSNCLDSPQSVSNGYNFSDDDSCRFTAPTDRQNAGSPGLGALADNGGPTPTQLPLAGSPLIDAIPATSCQADGATGITTDQRGVTRPQGGSCDIGAVEVAALAVPRLTFTG